MATITNSDMAWRHKAERWIAEEARKAYLEAGNRPGKKHKPYHLTPLAEALLDALNRNDEEKAKATFMIEEMYRS